MSIEYPASDNDAVFVTLLGSDLQEAEELKETFFVEGVAEWAAVRERKFGERVVPKHIFVEWIGSDTHRAAWVEHEAPQSGVPIGCRFHHIVCDCASAQEWVRDDFQAISQSCEVIQHAVIERAKIIGEHTGIKGLLSVYEPTDEDEEENFTATNDRTDLIAGTIENILIKDKINPEAWMGNLSSGAHNINLLSHIVHQSPAAVSLHAAILEMQGKVHIDDDTVRLVA